MVTLSDFQLSLPLSSPVMVFCLVLIIILAVPFLTRILRVPDIIGLILAGLVIGPNGTGILEKSSAIELFSTIGLLLTVKLTSFLL